MGATFALFAAVLIYDIKPIMAIPCGSGHATQSFFHAVVSTFITAGND